MNNRIKNSKIMIIYLVIKLVSLLFFRMNISNSFSYIYILFGMTPVIEFVFSIYIGMNWTKYRWVMAIFFGFMRMVTEYLANLSNLSFAGFKRGLIASIIGMLIVHIYTLCDKKLNGYNKIITILSTLQIITLFIYAYILIFGIIGIVHSHFFPMQHLTSFRTQFVLACYTFILGVFSIILGGVMKLVNVFVKDKDVNTDLLVRKRSNHEILFGIFITILSLSYIFLF